MQVPQPAVVNPGVDQVPPIFRFPPAVMVIVLVAVVPVMLPVISSVALESVILVMRVPELPESINDVAFKLLTPMASVNVWFVLGLLKVTEPNVLVKETFKVSMPVVVVVTTTVSLLFPAPG